MYCEIFSRSLWNTGAWMIHPGTHLDIRSFHGHWGPHCLRFVINVLSVTDKVQVIPMCYSFGFRKQRFHERSAAALSRCKRPPEISKASSDSPVALDSRTLVLPLGIIVLSYNFRTQFKSDPVSIPLMIPLAKSHTSKMAVLTPIPRNGT